MYVFKYVHSPHTGVNTAGDAGDTSPPTFWFGDVNGKISPISLHTLTLAPQNTPKYAISTL